MLTPSATARQGPQRVIRCGPCRFVHVAQLRAQGHEIRNEDVARLSPLKHRNLNVLGRYSFTPPVPHEGLRPLRDPDAVELDDDDDGGEDV